MSVCCIGGVCIPYTAIIPLLLLGLKWLAEKLAKMGVLPKALQDHLGIISSQQEENCNTTTATSCCCNTTTKKSKLVHSVESMKDWNSLKQQHDIVVVKFTAAWCRPCKEVAPVFSNLSEKYEHAQFVQVDVDELDDVASEHNVAIMPTFVVVKQGTVVANMKGSNPQKLTSFIEEHVSNVGESKS